MKVTPLAQCSSCSKAIPPLNRHVVRSAPTNGGVFLFFQCPYCGSAGSTFLGASEAKRRAREIEFTERERLRQEFIGREVKGMAVDLEAVDVVDDLLLFWNDQERFEPWTVVREKV